MDRGAALRRLERAHVAVLAFACDGEVHAMPVNVGVEDGAVWFRTGDGVKLAAARAGVRMAVLVTADDVVQHRGWNVTARGTATVSGDGPSDLRRPVRPWVDAARDGTWVRIDVDRVDGRELSARGAGAG